VQALHELNAGLKLWKPEGQTAGEQPPASPLLHLKQVLTDAVCSNP